MTIEQKTESHLHHSKAEPSATLLFTITGWFSQPVDKLAFKQAAQNTLLCLAGCATGDLAMILYLHNNFPDINPVLKMVLAISAGLFTSLLMETLLMRFRNRSSLLESFKKAASHSFLYIIAMELAMNITEMVIAGAHHGESMNHLLAFIPALFAGYLVPLPLHYRRHKKHPGASCH
jgi:hypothetical protein